MFTGPVGPVKVFFYWPEAVFGNFYWPGAIGLPLASSPDRYKFTGPYGPVTGLCPNRARNGPVFRSLNISTFHGLKTCNGPIILIIFTGSL